MVMSRVENILRSLPSDPRPPWHVVRRLTSGCRVILLLYGTLLHVGRVCIGLLPSSEVIGHS